jgi:hypothetical protein
MSKSLAAAALLVVVSCAPMPVVQNAAAQGKAEMPKLAPIPLNDGATSSALPASNQTDRVGRYAGSAPAAYRNASGGAPASAVASSPVTQVNAAATSDDGPKVDCRLPIRRIGSLDVGDSDVLIRAGAVEVRARYVDAQAAPLLRGTVVRMDAQGTGDDGNRQMSGLVYFNGGSILWQLGDGATAAGTALPAYSDQVFREAGTVIGQIMAISPQGMLVRSRETGQVMRIALDTITYVRSPRAFLFTIYGQTSADMTRTTVRRVAFQPTITSAPKLGSEVVVGRPRDPLDLDDDMPPPSILPAQTRFNATDNPMDGILPTRGGRPFPNWP